MPFMKGRAALRRTTDWLEKGQILLRDNVKIVTFNYMPVEADMIQTQQQQDANRFAQHNGLYKFIFWHLPQIKFKNPDVQLVTFKKMTPTPWIMAYLEDERKVVIDCDSRSREEIHDHVKRVLGKTEEMLAFEKAKEASITANPANFGFEFPRQCICELPGQIPCPRWQRLPKAMRGKWKRKYQAGEITLEELMDESEPQPNA